MQHYIRFIIFYLSIKVSLYIETEYVFFPRCLRAGVTFYTMGDDIPPGQLRDLVTKLSIQHIITIHPLDKVTGTCSCFLKYKVIITRTFDHNIKYNTGIR